MSSLSNSTRTHQFNTNKPTNRRYILEIPDQSNNIKTSTNHVEYTPRQVYDDYNNQNFNSDSKYNTKTFTKIRHENIDDPWVKKLLETDLDFSELYQEDSSNRVLTISNYPKYNSNSTPQVFSRSTNTNQKDFQNRSFRRHQYSPVGIKQNDKRTTLNSSQSHGSSQKWILEPSTRSPMNSNNLSQKKTVPVIYKGTINARQFNSPRINIDEEKYLLRHESNDISIKYRKNHKKNKKEKSNIWNLFTSKEKRNILIYIFGIMLYKFGIEAFNGSIVSLAANRYDRDASNSGSIAKTFEKIGLLVGLNQACQCIGSILIAPLIKHWPTRTILSISIFIFALFTALLMIIDAATGGKIKPSNFRPMHENDFRYYGNYPTNTIIPIYCVTGIAYGMVELIRRIIPRDIVGSDEEKLQRMDALVHIFYEIAGVSGALITGLVLIPRLGNNYSFLITPILFSLSGIVFMFINSLGTKSAIEDEPFSTGNQNHEKNYLKALITGFVLFGQSVYLGGKIIFTNRKYFWLFPCYSLTLYIHRYIENGIAPQIAKRYLQNSEWSQIIVGGSNFGELIGAVFVFLLTKKIRSPVVWLRLDAILLMIVWYIPFYNPSVISVKNAWIIALSFIPLGFGSAGDDISLNAHIQASLSQPQLKNKDISSLGAVMAFLYSSYIIIYAILNPTLGMYIDSVYNSKQTIRPAFIFTVGVQISIVAILVTLSTFIPKGSCKLNPILK